MTSWAREHVDSLQVRDFTSFSDHCPIVLNLTTFEPFEAAFILPDFSKMPAGFRWDNTNSQANFKAALNSPEISEKLTEIVNSDLPTTLEGNNQINSKMVECLQNAKEQLGFSKGAQTNDHVLTLKTLVDKYTKKMKVKLYACFVDLRKAFDTVCRDLLLHKIACLGISGNFFNCLSDMYRNSVACIKISKLLSPDIKIGKGTEQGHPLSPDLFKLYIRELSSYLNNAGDYPELADLMILHLLWADDLVLLALSPTALQENINLLVKFCQLKGLEINISKTKIVTFYPPRSKCKSSPEQFFLGNKPIKNTDKYCYLGVIFHSDGSNAAANTELRAKALRALYGLKGGIIKDALSPRSLFILFDSLIKPILLYGCQVLAPHSKTLKYLIKITDQSDPSNALKYLAQDHYEKFHMKFLKYALSVHSKSSNIGCWGETGRHPLIYEACKLAIDYYTVLSTHELKTLTIL